MIKKIISLITALMICAGIFTVESTAFDRIFISNVAMNIPEAPGLTVTLTDVYEFFYFGNAPDGNNHCYFLFDESGTATFNKDVHI